MIDELNLYYLQNEKQLNESFMEFCFYENRFETLREAKLYYNNDRAFWEFIRNKMESKRNWG